VSKSAQSNKNTDTAQEVKDLLQDVNVLNYQQKSANYEAERAKRLIEEIDHLHSNTHKKLSTSTQNLENPTSTDQDKDISENLSLRIGRLEREQQQALKQIKKLTDAKIQLELANIQLETQASEEQQRETKKIKARLVALITQREKEYKQLHDEVYSIQNLTQKETDLLTVQRDVALALVEEQKNNLKQQNINPDLPTGYKWLLILSILVILLVAGIITRVVYLSLQDQPVSDNLQAASPSDIKHINKTTPIMIKTVILKLPHFKDKLHIGHKGPEMIQIPAGRFKMGSRRPFHSEYPEIKIKIQSYAISKYEITFQDYLLFTQDTDRAVPHDENWGKGKQPVINVRWQDANDYSQWLSKQTGHQYRLPSEREWEYAAKAGKNSKYWWGNQLGSNHANCSSCGSSWDGQSPAPVGSFPANPFGLHDMVGNVMEWSHTCYHSNYKDAPKSENLWSKGDCNQRIVRGGSFSSYKKELRMSKRRPFNPKARSNQLGFRVVRLD